MPYNINVNVKQCPFERTRCAFIVFVKDMGKKDIRFITLKEAAKISGYTSDYVGQLIRQGKLSGKQVYCAMAWVTTEEALCAYMAKAQSEGKSQAVGASIVQKLYETKNRLFLRLPAWSLIRAFLYAIIALSIGFSLFLFHIVSVNFDKQLQQKAAQIIEDGNTYEGLD